MACISSHKTKCGSLRMAMRSAIIAIEESQSHTMRWWENIRRKGQIQSLLAASPERRTQLGWAWRSQTPHLGCRSRSSSR
eukprot:12937796-Prorocentrum_lima.AAC.1